MKRGSLLTSIACLALAPSAAWTQTNLLDGIGTAPGVAQRIEWLHRNALVVRSINPDDLDFSSLPITPQNWG
ncbi:MAG: hypothetical protein LAQ30_32645 [Acidobacteriia bacterium]|nr:hypothetical protein [Terriglobia bacterium]